MDMMNFDSKATIQSEAIPGASFTIFVLNRGKRVALDMTTATDREALRQIQRDKRPLLEQARPLTESETRDAAQVEALEQLADRAAPLNEAEALHVERIRAATIRAALLSVDGFTIDNETPTVDALLERGPDVLIEEIANAIVAAISLSEEQQKNWRSPSTSRQVEGGQASATTAPNADATAGIATQPAVTPIRAA